ncbi:MAG: AAA family ATPase [Oscillospiraceae bacterium]
MKQTHFFLGANSAEGFYGLYDQLLDARLYDLIILKGTPGCGKSTFMRRAAAALEERGLESVYIHCSGDPDSLDGVIAPAIRTAIVDGTAPHVLEPRYALAHERYVDLSQCCDSAAAKEVANGLTALTDAYRASYREAYHVLRALGSVDAERRALVRAHFDEESCCAARRGSPRASSRAGRDAWTRGGRLSRRTDLPGQGVPLRQRGRSLPACL